MVAPAPEIGLIVYHARESTIGADLDGRAALAEVDTGQVVTHFPWPVANPGVGRVVRLAACQEIVVAEALDVAVVQQNARVAVARCDLDRVAASPKADERQRVAHGRSVIPAVHGVAVAEVSTPAEAFEPARQSHTVLNDNAREKAPGSDLYGLQIRPEVDRLHFRSQAAAGRAIGCAMAVRYPATAAELTHVVRIPEALELSRRAVDGAHVPSRLRHLRHAGSRAGMVHS